MLKRILFQGDSIIDCGHEIIKRLWIETFEKNK